MTRYHYGYDGSGRPLSCEVEVLAVFDRVALITRPAGREWQSPVDTIGGEEPGDTPDERYVPLNRLTD